MDLKYKSMNDCKVMANFMKFNSEINRNIWL